MIRAKHTLWAQALLALAAAATGASSAWADARVLDLAGPVSRVGARGSEPLRMLDRVANNDTLVSGAQGQLTLIIDGSGAQFALQGAGRWLLTAEGLKTLDGAAPRPLAVAAPNLRPLPTGSRAMAGATAMRNGAGTDLAPQPDAAKLLALPATLSWRDGGAASRYRVQLATASGDQLLDTTCDEPQLALAAVGKLRPGGSYAWGVEVLAGPRRGTRSFAAFSVADEATQQQWAALKPQADEPVSQWVLYANALDSAGYAFEARQAWHEVAQRRPDLIPPAAR
jgi:hypothetical protein